MPRSSQDDKNFLSMAGEFLVAAELNRRHMHSAVTYGTAKSADVWAFDRNGNRAVRVEVELTTDKTRGWVIGGEKGEVREGWDPDVLWVLVLLPPPHPTTAETNDEQRGQHSPRFFVLTSEEIGRLLCGIADRYRAAYLARNKRDFTGPGVPNLKTAEALPFENARHKVEPRMRKPTEGQCGSRI